MIVKSEKVNENIKDLEEVFNMLRKFRVKVNPVFGIVGGKFLGFIISYRGIKTNYEN